MPCQQQPTGNLVFCSESEDSFSLESPGADGTCNAHHLEIIAQCEDQSHSGTSHRSKPKTHLDAPDNKSKQQKSCFFVDDGEKVEQVSVSSFPATKTPQNSRASSAPDRAHDSQDVEEEEQSHWQKNLNIPGNYRLELLYAPKLRNRLFSKFLLSEMYTNRKDIFMMNS